MQKFYQHCNSAEILQAVGMHCLGCAMAHGETIEQAVYVHGNDLDKVLEKLNEGVSLQVFLPKRSKTFH